MEKLDTKTRKKAFDQLFKATIIPFFEKEGFVSVSKTSKKLSKSFLNGLSVYIYFEYIQFLHYIYILKLVYIYPCKQKRDSYLDDMDQVELLSSSIKYCFKD